MTQSIKCLHCDSIDVRTRGLCQSHYRAARKLASEYGDALLIEKGVWLESARKKGNSMYNQLKNLIN